MERVVSIKQIKYFLEKEGLPFRICGDLEKTVTGFSSLSRYRVGTITWNNSKKALSKFPPHVSVCVVQEGAHMESDVQILSSNSKAVFFSILEHFWGDEQDNSIPSIGPGTVVGHNVHLGEDVRIDHNCSLIGNISIGDGTIIEANVTIGNHVIIGDHCHIKAGAVIGGRGFGYSKNNGQYHPVRHFGSVVIGNNVDVGSNTCIDSGTIDDTVIHDGVKIDNLCHIAHNVIIDENTIVIANSTICGSVHIGKNAYIAPHSVIMNQLEIGDDAIIGMGSVVTKDVADNKVVMGTPAKVIRENSGKEKL